MLLGNLFLLAGLSLRHVASQQQIDKLDQVVVAEHTGEECAICMEEYNVGDKQLVFPCGNGQHCFHTKCAVRWLKTCSGTCPLCRTSL